MSGSASIIQTAARSRQDGLAYFDNGSYHKAMTWDMENPRPYPTSGRGVLRRPTPRSLPEIPGMPESPDSACNDDKGAALTPRTPAHRLPAPCLSGSFRSELSARSADR